MGNSKKKRFNELRKNHSWITIVLFFIISFVTAGIIVAYLEAFLVYFMDNKISAECDDAVYMAKMYDKAVAEGKYDVFGFLDASGRTYLIRNESGKMTYLCGDDTLSSKSGTFGITGSSKTDRAKVFLDKESEALYLNDNGTLVINILEVISDIRKYSASEVFDEIDEEESETGHISVDIDIAPGFLNSFGDIDNEMLYFPFWIAEDVSGGTMYVKSFISVSVKDVILFGSFIVIILLMLITIFIIMLVSFISGIVRRRRTLSVFFTDVVTGGRNFTWFIIKGQQLLTKRKNYSSRFAVISLVFVNYRNFCVCHTVAEGEKVLKTLYDTISGSLGKKEMCAHCSSADFALLLRYTDDESLRQRIRDLISALEKTGNEHKFAFHAGIASIEPDGTPDKYAIPIRRRKVDIETEYNNACTARAELDGSDDSGTAFFDDKLFEDQKWIDIVQEHQQSALANEEFMVYYQPKYDPRTDELRGAEALIRWQSPEFGFVPPGRIIPIYEKNGFITEIDHYMIRHVARDQKAWLDKGCKCVPVSVNVSRAHFIESDLAEQIRDMIDAEGTPHELIEIELTESAFFDDKKAMISTITRLKEYGFAVSMDDFGSGYSSLNSLKDMPLDVLKLDAEFFRGENGDGRGDIVVSEAIKLAKSLNMRTVAEGVEIRDQVDFLAAQGCDMIQGYYYAKPMPKNEYEQRMRPAQPAADVQDTAPVQAEGPEQQETAAVPEAAAAPETPVDPVTVDVPVQPEQPSGPVSAEVPEASENPES